MEVIRHEKQADVVRVKVADLVQRKGNEWIKANKQAVARIAEDMRERGFDDDEPIIIHEDGGVEDGRHRVLAAKEAGIEEVIAIIPGIRLGRPDSRSFNSWVGKVRRAAGFDVVDYLYSPPAPPEPVQDAACHRVQKRLSDLFSK